MSTFQCILRVLRTVSDYLAGNIDVDRSLPCRDFRGHAASHRIIVILCSSSTPYRDNDNCQSRWFNVLVEHQLERSFSRKSSHGLY